MSTSDFSSHYRDVRAETFVGRDMHLNVEVHLTGEQLQERLDQLLPLLRQADVSVGDGVVSAQGQRLAIDSAAADALVKYIAAKPTEDAQEREEAYLTRLCLNTGLRRIYSRYVPLSGGYRPVRGLSPTYSRILVRGEGPQRTIERVRLDDIRQAVDEHPAFVLLAQPGAGKTTVLQRLALEMALKRLQEGDEALLPLFVRLAAQKPEEAPLDFLGRMWREEAPGLHTDASGEIAIALRQGRLCLLCDALNEARQEKYRERVMDWADFARQLPAGNQLIFTCRIQDYSGGLAVQQVEVDPLSPEQIQGFARLYLGQEKGAALWKELQSAHSDLLDLATIPYYLLLMTEAYEGAGTLPRHRAGLFASFVERLLLREMEEKRHADWIDPAAQHLALSRLAFAMQRLGTGTEVDTDLALDAIPQSIRIEGQTIATAPETILRLGRAANLLALADGDSVSFIQHLLQEYIAAIELRRLHWAGEDLTALWQVPSLEREMPEAVRGQWDPLPEPPTRGWEQTTILASGLYPALIDTVQRVNPALAARCLLELGEDGDAAQIERSQKALLERLGNVAIHLRSRMEAGLLLGRLGDPRFVAETVNGVQVILPPMVDIAGGMAEIGSDESDAEADDYERPRHPVQLSAYAIGRYPVTNAEYECFLKAGGYAEERYWSDGGKHWLKGEQVPGEDDPADYWIRTWRRFKDDPAEIGRWVQQGRMTERDADNPWRILITWTEEQVVAQVREWYPQNVVVREPRFWNDAAFNNPSQPVVGVCWYEAVAYANWLSEVTGTAYRLPTEPEWEWAARRGGRAFPWGRDWDETKLNSLDGRVMRTTPVGAYPQGTTPDGLHDLAGNVWEWTATRYAAYPYDQDADLENQDATGLRIVRGGGWSSNRKMVRCAYRLRSLARYGYYRGYRLARTLSR
ncbi:MAG: SUMF1/EgtB/PvdO family nonheme iron enzyme [Chloroflexi bacterium]|nr:SUMF1/EgtB/PvdO family nonheme iron enzyme [Chloroflexota bacterium]